MFDNSLIGAGPELPTGYKIRFMEPGDYENGVLDVYKVLTTVGQISKEKFVAQLEFWAGQAGTYFPLVITNPNHHVVACGTCIVEAKLIHECGRVGHIEDIAVAKSQQGLSLGKKLIQTLSHVAEQAGCYKVILDCDEKNVGFYEKCGYNRAGVEMDLRF